MKDSNLCVLKDKKMNNAEKRAYDASVSIERRANGLLTRHVTIRAAVFNSLSKSLGGFKETIDQGAFDGADMSDVVAVLNHDFNILYARTSSKTLSLSIDSTGLIAKFEAPNTSHGNDLLEMIQRGDIRQASFQFMVENDRWVSHPTEGDVRIIQKFKKIVDVSPVVFPAYADTSVAMRSRNNNQGKSIPLSVIHAEAEYLLMKIRSCAR